MYVRTRLFVFRRLSFAQEIVGDILAQRQGNSEPVSLCSALLNASHFFGWVATATPCDSTNRQHIAIALHANFSFYAEVMSPSLALHARCLVY